MVKVIIFRFIAGFGNRLCNLINMIHLHNVFPKAKIYVEWNINNHCGIQLDRIIDLTEFDYINYNYKYVGGETYASTSNVSRTKWDNIQNWKQVDVIVSVSFYLYSFVSYSETIQTFDNLPFNDEIITLVNQKCEQCGSDKNIIHFRGGDLLKLLQDNEHDGSHSIKEHIMQEIAKHKDCEMFNYEQAIVDRSSEDVLNSIADLIYLAKCNIIKGYCPYSHFSSWIYLLSDQFVDNQKEFPIFNYRQTRIVFV